MNVDKIFVHCSATPPSMDIGVAEIRAWHTKPIDMGGRGWNDIGYHFVIRRDGTLEHGRNLTTPGAHTYGYNKNSFGICMVGGIDKDNKPDANFTLNQYETLVGLIKRLEKQHNITKIYGHREVAAKACPSFDIHGLLEYT